MIKISNLSASYGRHTVFNDVSVCFDTGKVIGILGSNGSGKTTFFNILYRFLENYGGTCHGKLQYKASELQRSNIAYLMQDFYFYPYITGSEYLSLIGSDNDNNPVFKSNNIFELPLDDLVETYSEGMKKKLVLSGLLQLNRDIYLFDEPYSGLDLEGVHILNRLIDKLNEYGKTVLIASHILDAIKNISDDFYFIHDKSIKRIDDIDQFDYLKWLDKKLDDKLS